MPSIEVVKNAHSVAQRAIKELNPDSTIQKFEEEMNKILDTLQSSLEIPQEKHIRLADFLFYCKDTSKTLIPKDISVVQIYDVLKAHRQKVIDVLNLNTDEEKIKYAPSPLDCPYDYDENGNYIPIDPRYGQIFNVNGEEIGIQERSPANALINENNEIVLVPSFVTPPPLAIEEAASEVVADITCDLCPIGSKIKLIDSESGGNITSRVEAEIADFFQSMIQGSTDVAYQENGYVPQKHHPNIAFDYAHMMNIFRSIKSLENYGFNLEQIKGRYLDSEGSQASSLCPEMHQNRGGFFDFLIFNQNASDPRVADFTYFKPPSNTDDKSFSYMAAVGGNIRFFPDTYKGLLSMYSQTINHELEHSIIANHFDQKESLNGLLQYSNSYGPLEKMKYLLEFKSIVPISILLLDNISLKDYKHQEDIELGLLDQIAIKTAICLSIENGGKERYAKYYADCLEEMKIFNATAIFRDKVQCITEVVETAAKTTSAPTFQASSSAASIKNPTTTAAPTLDRTSAPTVQASSSAASEFDSTNTSWTSHQDSWPSSTKSKDNDKFSTPQPNQTPKTTKSPTETQAEWDSTEEKQHQTTPNPSDLSDSPSLFDDKLFRKVFDQVALIEGPALGGRAIAEVFCKCAGVDIDSKGAVSILSAVENAVRLLAIYLQYGEKQTISSLAIPAAVSATKAADAAINLSGKAKKLLTNVANGTIGEQSTSDISDALTNLFDSTPQFVKNASAQMVFVLLMYTVSELTRPLIMEKEEQKSELNFSQNILAGLITGAASGLLRGILKFIVSKINNREEVPTHPENHDPRRINSSGDISYANPATQDFRQANQISNQVAWQTSQQGTEFTPIYLTPNQTQSTTAWQGGYYPQAYGAAAAHHQTQPTQQTTAWQGGYYPQVYGAAPSHHQTQPTPAELQRQQNTSADRLGGNNNRNNQNTIGSA